MKVLVRLYLRNFLPSKEMNSPERLSEYMDIRVHGVVTYSVLVYFINVFSRDRNKTKSLSSCFRTKKNNFGKCFTKYRKCLRIYRIYKIQNLFKGNSIYLEKIVQHSWLSMLVSDMFRIFYQWKKWNGKRVYFGNILSN